MIDLKIRGMCELQRESSTYIHVTIKCEGCVVLFFSYDQGSVFLPQGFCDLTRFFDEATDQHHQHTSVRHKGECSRIFYIFLDILYVCLGLMSLGYVV